MADITKCTNSLCPNAGHCRRVTAEDGLWQSWAKFEYTIGAEGVECDNYLPGYKYIMTNTSE